MSKLLKSITSQSMCIYTRFELEWIKTSQINSTFSSYFQCCNDLEISSGSHKSDTACVKLNGSYPALFERAHLVPEQKRNSNALFRQEIELLPAYHSHEKHLLPDFGLFYIYKTAIPSFNSM